MLIYRQGSHFKKHADTEKEKNGNFVALRDLTTRIRMLEFILAKKGVKPSEMSSLPRELPAKTPEWERSRSVLRKYIFFPNLRFLEQIGIEDVAHAKIQIQALVLDGRVDSMEKKNTEENPV